MAGRTSFSPGNFPAFIVIEMVKALEIPRCFEEQIIEICFVRIVARWQCRVERKLTFLRIAENKIYFWIYCRN